MSAKQAAPAPRGRTSARSYSASLQQAAAAVFGVAVIDGEPPFQHYKNSRENK